MLFRRYHIEFVMDKSPEWRWTFRWVSEKRRARLLQNYSRYPCFEIDAVQTYENGDGI